MGDRAALEALLRREYDRAYAVCRRVTGSAEDGADAAQDALISIARNLSSFDGRSKFSTWTYRIAVNAALDEVRRRQRRPEPTELHLVPDAGVDPSSGTVDRVDIEAALRQMPEEFRAPVVLRDLCGLDYTEIGEVLDIPGGTVKSRIARGRRQLSEILAGNHEAPASRHNQEP